MAKKEFTLLKEYLYWSFSNLAMAHSAVDKKAEKYIQISYIIRARLFKGLMQETMNVGSIIDDERMKMKLPQICSYCGSSDNLSVDHLIPKFKGGEESGDNFVWACRKCNSSKNRTDLMEWYNKRGTFPPLLLLRRYLKLIIDHCSKNDLLDLSLEEAKNRTFPFSFHSIPQVFPKPPELKLWITEI
ncbi:MAG: HNH endonuclease [SAR324 cluster bacterium]|nr:HNH endonuclease [SAR324 cluster bacterium]